MDVCEIFIKKKKKFRILFTDLHFRLSKTKNQVKGGFLLNVVISKGSTILELFASEDEALLVRWNSFFVLDFLFDVFNSVRRFNIKSDCFAS